MTMVKLLFYLMAITALGSALYVAGSKNLVRSVFMFFVTLFALAGLYVLALADFVAITQIVIYVGGILVLIIFAFMLSGKETLSAVKQVGYLISAGKVISFIMAAMFFSVFVIIILKADANNLEWVKKAVVTKNLVLLDGSSTENIGTNLMTIYLLPFEVISVLLLMALVGAAHLSRKEQNA